MVPGRVITLVMTMVFLFIPNNICTPLCLCLGMAQCIRHLPLGKRDGGGGNKIGFPDAFQSEADSGKKQSCLLCLGLERLRKLI